MCHLAWIPLVKLYSIDWIELVFFVDIDERVYRFDLLCGENQQESEKNAYPHSNDARGLISLV